MKTLENKRRRAARIIRDLKIAVGAMTCEIYRLQKEIKRLNRLIAEQKRRAEHEKVSTLKLRRR